MAQTQNIEYMRNVKQNILDGNSPQSGYTASGATAGATVEGVAITATQTVNEQKHAPKPTEKHSLDEAVTTTTVAVGQPCPPAALPAGVEWWMVLLMFWLAAES